MNEEDLTYVCTVISDLAGIPIRLYKNDSLVFYHSTVYLPVDPFNHHRDAVFEIKEHVGYYITFMFNYYGVVNFKENRIVIGPSRQVPATDQELRELAFYNDVPSRDMNAFLSGMKSLIPMPFESIIEMLCVINFVLNGEKLSSKDVVIKEDTQQAMKAASVQDTFSYGDENQTIHNTIDIENAVMSIVREGNTAVMEEWMSNAPSVRAGVLADNQLRQLKNTFIVSATLAARAAIQGGLDQDVALSLSDSYIQKAECFTTQSGITNLQYRMFLDYTERVEKVKGGKEASKLVLKVGNYVQQHLSEPVSVDQIADSLYLSRPYLSSKFKEETGENLTDYILKMKVSEAKRLLRYTDNPISSVSAYLGFSSQSHFTKVFKKYTGTTPFKYRGNVSSD